MQINDPYKGGDLVAAFGAPSRRRHSLQIEINRGRYLDEAACAKGPEFALAQASLTRYLAAAVVWIRTHSA